MSQLCPEQRAEGTLPSYCEMALEWLQACGDQRAAATCLAPQ